MNCPVPGILLYPDKASEDSPKHITKNGNPQKSWILIESNLEWGCPLKHQKANLKLIQWPDLTYEGAKARIAVARRKDAEQIQGRTMENNLPCMRHENHCFHTDHLICFRRAGVSGSLIIILLMNKLTLRMLNWCPLVRKPGTWMHLTSVVLHPRVLGYRNTVF